MHIAVHPSLTEIDAVQWNAMLKDNNPFMRHEFLAGLELCGCVSKSNGWQGTHIAVYSDASQRSLIGAMPCYIKQHSYGEYIFDWSWADAHNRHGLDYYPKLSNAIPFTPATGERWLVNNPDDAPAVTRAIIDKVFELVDDLELSSFHSLFLEAEKCEELCSLGPRSHGFLKRHSTQFHWQNKGYQSFDDFLSLMSSKKRKNIKRERRRVKDSGITYRWLSNDELDAAAVATMYKFYSRTIAYYGAQSYLNKAFFDYLATSFNQQTLFLFAYYNPQGSVETRAEQIIAGGLYFKSDNTLYGRYWGALNNFHSVHFETCYYQAIQWCIEHSYQRFEAGAQGEHKLARGLEPTTTYSAHWIKHPEFRQAIGNFLQQEQAHIEHYESTMQTHSPFKNEV